MDYKRLRKCFAEGVEEPEYVFNLWYPFSYRKYLKLVFFLEAFLLIQACTTSFSVIALLNTLTMYVVLKLKLLQFGFKNFDRKFNTNNGNWIISHSEAIENLKSLIEEHQGIIRWDFLNHKGIMFYVVI